ncbi:efflux RND transporter periplasmic adaptor subunit [uncultured Shimia sp.]|uniref:HlyD family secretion protein n=1 Tax=uncultured Shimia sp. TaxID=573152 RepID=UPI00262E46F0|nr:efflux RND transporter periplasmic adaptor subunit [uncultured Shimia sp.]
MIMIIIGVWLAILWVLVKIGVLKKWHLWMKLSPVAVWLIANIVLFLPLNWTAPVGPVTVTVSSVQIAPAVSGVVEDVPAVSWRQMKQGDVLFRIGALKYEAAVRQAQARVSLAEDVLSRKRQLLTSNTVAQAEIDKLEADVAVANAQLSIAQEDLKNTVVVAPMEGIVPAVTLLPGDRVSASVPVMAFLDVDRPFVNLILKQNGIRNVRAGQPAEVVFRNLPGQTFSAKVARLYLSSPDAEYVGTGLSPRVPEVRDTQYVVGLEVDLGDIVLPPGASGQGAVLTDQVGALGVIRQITLRMTTWMNYL